MTKKKGLGRSLNDLMSTPTEWMFRDDLKIFFCPLDTLEPNPYQPRIAVEDDESLEELAVSIKEKGLLQPLIVTQGSTKGRYVIIAGERRWRAARKAGLSEVPVILKEASSVEAVELALIENIQRKDLTCIEEALAYRRLQEEFGLTQEDIANRVGKSRSAVANTMRLLALPEDIQKDVLEGRLSMGHARALLSLPDRELMHRLRDQILAQGLTVRETERRAHLLSERFHDGSQEGDKNRSLENRDYFTAREQLISSILRTEVKIRRFKKKLQIVIEAGDEEELDRIVSQIVSQTEKQDTEG
ncbi:ParB/RepB/Spo0J family partition protein [Thermodesulforhabdus norvegica]|uniref:Chromosome partitioning protein, ParB family n=1 Tax=Thermodesulforhabdus norvegica TaxID=39841 RepID=A0A1I4RBE2_9BACT|nr:ParB/RepB/Spo0J family partition protein [Thermodesulforhabdus norvegica]SFM49280.1 chromosome partitioning protein, ParB family [Thermodesulforhabdus norvegica]